MRLHYLIQNLGFAVWLKTYLEWFGKVNRRSIQSTGGMRFSNAPSGLRVRGDPNRVGFYDNSCGV
jgi:hypothetical protein